jgi:hypothetical protein
MPAYYFAIEGHHTGEKPDPSADTIIAIQYQKIDLTSGEPLEKVTILKAWESSEKDIVTRFYHEFLRPGLSATHFIPVGMNLDYAFEQLIAKCRLYHLPELTSRQLYYQRPRFDLAPVIVLLNDGRFAGASLDTFSSKKSDAGRISTWYEKQEFKQILYTLQDEAETFLRLLQYLSKYKTRLGVTRKGETARHRPAETTSPARAAKVRPAPPGPSAESPKRRVDSETPALSGSPGHLLKAPSPSSRKSPARSKEGSPAPIHQLRKHTPAKRSAAKKRDAGRGEGKE